MRRNLLVLAVIIVGGLGLVTVASSGHPSAITSFARPAAAVHLVPASGAGDADPQTPATVTVDTGRLEQVALTDATGAPVTGKLSPDGRTWTSAGRLHYGATYTWSGTVREPEGGTELIEGSFTTKAPTKKIRATVNIGDGRTVGVAAPVRIQFNGHVQDRAAVEKALTLTTDKPVEGSWGWLPDEGGGSRVDYRPKVYWPAYTKVSVSAKLDGLDYGGGAVGASDVSSSFTIGRAQIVKADVNSFHMVVVRDGQTVADYPASYGLGTDPERNTRSGVHVVSEKFTDKRMVSRQYDYDVMEKWAVRISNNGEFIHANPKSAAAQGSANVTHGCVNLSDADAKAYYDSALYGDPVEVTGTPVKLASRDGDIWDWTLGWSQWKGLSALD